MVEDSLSLSEFTSPLQDGDQIWIRKVVDLGNKHLGVTLNRDISMARVASASQSQTRFSAWRV